MPQHDLDITTADANTGVTYRAQVNAALQALGTLQSGASAPSTTYAYMLWADTTSGWLRQRNAANNGWINIWRLGDPGMVVAGTSEPTNMVAHMLWADTTSGWLRQRNAANNGWINIWRLAEQVAVPAGAVMCFAMSAAPTGWLVCNGAAVSRSMYAALFAAIGTTYGAGDGSTTFNVPDYRGEFFRGWDDGRGADSGRTMASWQGWAIQSHTHTVSSFANAGWLNYGWRMASTHSPDSTIETSGTGGAETRPRNWSVRVCIKF